MRRLQTNGPRNRNMTVMEVKLNTLLAAALSAGALAVAFEAPAAAQNTAGAGDVHYEILRGDRVLGEEQVRHSPAPFPSHGDRLLESTTRTIYSGGRVEMGHYELRTSPDWVPIEIRISVSAPNGPSNLHGGFAGTTYQVQFSTPRGNDAREFQTRPPTYLIEDYTRVVFLQAILYAHHEHAQNPQEVATIDVQGRRAGTLTLDFAGYRQLGEVDAVTEGEGEADYRFWRVNVGSTALHLWTDTEGGIRRIEEPGSGLIIRPVGS